MSRESNQVPTDRIDAAVHSTNRSMTAILHWISRHWLLLANIGIGSLIILPVLAPICMHLGLTTLGESLYRLFRASCHQLPERSFFLFGKQAVYSLETLRQLAGDIPLRYIGNPEIGYKIAVCERDTAIYGSMFLTGLLFNFMRNMKPLRIKLFLVMALPMVIDGTGGLIGLWSGTWLNRVVTGILFGSACILLCYPYLNQGMQDIYTETQSLLEEMN